MIDDKIDKRQSDVGGSSPLGALWQGSLQRLREDAPDWAVNESARLNFGLRTLANALTVKSGLRSGALMDEALHAPFFEQYPNQLPQSQKAFSKGMRIANFASPRRAIAGSFSLVAVGIGTIYGEKQQTQEELDAYRAMPTGEFVKMRIGHAFDPAHHAGALVGMADIANGVFTFGSGLHQFTGFHGRFNWRQIPFECVRGAMGIAAGAAMQFMPDQQKAWQLSQGIYLLRSPVAAAQAWRAFKHGIPGRVDAGEWELPTKFMLNHSSSFFGLAFGGVEKHQGQLVDSKTLDQPMAEVHDVVRERSCAPMYSRQ